MLRIFISFCLFGVFLATQAQIRPSNVVFDHTFNVGYEQGVAHPSYSNYYNPEEYNHLTYSLYGGVSYAISPHLLLGAGLTFDRESYKPILEESESSSASGYYYRPYHSEITTFSTGYSPTVRLEYLGQVAPRLYVTMGLSLQYSFVKDERIRRDVDFNYGDNPPYLAPTYTITEEVEVFHSESYHVFLSPSIRYNFIKWMGMQLNFGHIGIDQQLKDTSVEDFKPSPLNFRASLSPSNWRFGVFFVVGK